jgi:hypothetical protein
MKRFLDLIFAVVSIIILSLPFLFDGAGLAGFIASPVTDRSTEEFEGTSTGIAESGLIA